MKSTFTTVFTQVNYIQIFQILFYWDFSYIFHVDGPVDPAVPSKSSPAGDEDPLLNSESETTVVSRGDDHDHQNGTEPELLKDNPTPVLDCKTAEEPPDTSDPDNAETCTAQDSEAVMDNQNEDPGDSKSNSPDVKATAPIQHCEGNDLKNEFCVVLYVFANQKICKEHDSIC